jgi:small subunit ribosomal protein S21
MEPRSRRDAAFVKTSPVTARKRSERGRENSEGDRFCRIYKLRQLESDINRKHSPQQNGSPGRESALSLKTACEAWERGVFTLAEVRLQEGEPLENALRRFKRKVQQEDIIKEVKRHSFYLKPGEKKRVKEALARKRNRKKVRKEQD